MATGPIEEDQLEEIASDNDEKLKQMERRIVQLEKYINSQSTAGIVKEKIMTNRRQSVHDTLKDSEITGITDMYETGHLAGKLFWIIIVVLAVAFTAIFLFQQYSEYLDTPILTDYRVIHDTNGIEFPEILICPQHNGDRSRLQKLDVDTDWLAEWLLVRHTEGNPRYRGHPEVLRDILLKRLKKNEWNQASSMPTFHSIEDGYADFGTPFPGYLLHAFDHSQDMAPMKRFNNSEFMDFHYRKAYLANELITACMYGGIANMVDCSYDMVYHDEFGICYQIYAAPAEKFQSKTKFKQTSKGFLNGLFLVIDLSHDKAYNKLGEFHMPLDGIHVAVTNDVPIDVTSDDTYTVQIGSQTDVLLEKRLTKLINQNKTTCQEAEDMDGMMSKFKILNITKHNYTVQGCKLECLLQIGLDVCGCVRNVDPRFLHQNYKDMICGFSSLRTTVCFRRLDYVEELHEKLQNCREDCKEACQTTRYLVTASGIKYPSVRFRELLTNNGNYFPLNTAVAGSADQQLPVIKGSFAQLS